MKHIKKFNESWIDSVKDFGREKLGIGQDKFESELSSKMIKIVEICENDGYRLFNGAGDITDGHDVWVYKFPQSSEKNKKNIALYPDYRKGVLRIEWIPVTELIITLNLKDDDVESLANQIMRVLDDPERAGWPAER